MTRRRAIPIHVYCPPGSRWVILRGPARDLLTEAGVHGRWSNIDRGYEIAADHLPDLLARAAAHGILVRLHEKAATP